jgi:primosomal protein N' (replication factor Y)
LLGAWAGGSLDILIGTQMVAKGHDVPGVTLVGVLLADSSLNFPDFRAAERTFQLLAQVAGRAGRGERRGRVFVQTLQPDHYSLQAAVKHDFAGFAEREIAARREVGYPPFARLVLLRVEGERLADVEQLAEWVARQLRERSRQRFVVLGPAPAPLQRLRQRHRRQILVRGGNSSVLRRSVAEMLESARSRARARKVRLIADVDPYNML